MAKPKVISLFTGVGGLDHGLAAAGFDVAVAVEQDAACIEHLRRLGWWDVIHGDIHEVPTPEILSRAGLGVGDASVLAGGPPCQPFSKAGFWANGQTQRLRDHRAGTLDAYLRVLRDALPECFLLENVEGLAYRGKSEGLDFLTSRILQISKECGVSYSISVQKLNAADYGIPQLRERVFVVGHREGKTFEFPKPTHAPGDIHHLLGLEPYRTAWDAIGDLEDDSDSVLSMRGKWADLLPTIPEGENYLWHTSRKGGCPLFGWRRRYWSFLLKLSKRLPSWTIPAQPGPATGPFHWKNRRLSSRELCRLQTLPEHVEFSSPIATVQKQLGNAVPSALSELLGLEIRSQLLGQPINRRELKLIPKCRTPVPPEEPLAKVLQKYRRLAGQHAPHPGTGGGYAAIARSAR